MPKSFSNYKSEHVVLFYILKEFNECVERENFTDLLLLSNALSRFTELYTLTKYPSNNESSVKDRINLIFKQNKKPHNNIKLLNFFLLIKTKLISYNSTMRK